MNFHPDPKHKAVRLHGKKLIDLYRRVYERDGGHCKCGAWVEPGTIPHHITFKSQGGPDEESNLRTLCQKCHMEAHKIR